jgi:hypothetical protein
MGILDELLKKSTGMQSLLNGSLDDASGMNSDFERPFETPNPNYKPDSRSNLPDFLNPEKDKTTVQNPSYQRKVSPLVTGTAFEKNSPVVKATDISTNGVVPPEKPNAITELGKNPGLFKNIFGMDMDKMSENWKKKGGFEGLMANPGFLLGMSILQSSAQGQSIGSGVFDAAVKAGTISAAYADRIKARSKVVAPISDAQRKQAEAALTAMNVGGPGWLDKLKNLDTNQEALYQEALEKVADKAQALAEKEAASSGGKRVRLEPKHYRKAVDDLVLSGEIDKQKGSLFGMIPGSITAKVSKTEKSFRAKGGPVKAGKDYVVGEEGPEMFVSETNGTIINNDDSKVVSMLLESNPQLKNVSRARAVKILKARFPDYF